MGEKWKSKHELRTIGKPRIHLTVVTLSEAEAKIKDLKKGACKSLRAMGEGRCLYLCKECSFWDGKKEYSYMIEPRTKKPRKKKVK